MSGENADAGNKSGVSSQVLSLPSGGGAIGGTGGGFVTNRQTGAGTKTVEIDVPEGRNGMQPRLRLSYSTGNSHGVAGMGWSLGVGSVSRRTDDGVPTYDDATDGFALTGGTKLVAVERSEREGTTVTRHRPRSESAFDRITHRTSETTDHWVVESTDGTVSYYGTPDTAGADPAAVADPSDRSKVFSWHLSRTVDPFGNEIRYEYDRDTGRTADHHWDELYLDRVKYVDHDGPTPDADDGAASGAGAGDGSVPAADGHLVTVEFAYDSRPDPFSTYTAGFERRMRRRLARVVVSTHADRHRPVRSYELTYRDEPDAPAEPPANGTSQLASVQLVGHDDEDTERMPPLEFEYSAFAPDEREFEPVTGPVPRRSLADPELELADLSGDGLPDIVEVGGRVRYWENLGDGEFDEPQPMERAPAGLSLADPEVQLLDADGDGRIDLVSLSTELGGYFPLERTGGWAEESFQPYDRLPSVSPADPGVQFLDLDGDGVTDMLRTGSAVECFYQDPDEGWSTVERVPGPPLSGAGELDLSDPRIRLADCCGDGLQDVVRVESGHVSYWPNLGHGEWGPSVRMANPPDLPADHDPGRVMLGDVDGDGAADLVYVADTHVRLWLNRCGNGWSDPVEIDGTPPVTDTDAVRLVDLEGTGVGGLLYGDDEMYFLDFVGGEKPYLLVESRDNMGTSHRIEYAPSTAFYLRDERSSDRPDWRTRLPNPTWVVERTETLDHVAAQKLVTAYEYHHGYWDGAEREFRGFGMVERRDTETVDAYNEAGAFDADAFGPVAEDRFAPPVLEKTWFHLGPVGPEHGDWQELDYAGEFWTGDQPVLSRPDGTREALAALDRRDRRDAVRSLAGVELRRERYALDGSDRADRPYEVSERVFGVRPEVTAATDDRESGVYFAHPRERRATRWERGEDPKSRFEFTTDYDAYGNARTTATVRCPRFWRPGDRSRDYAVEFTRKEYAAVDDPDRYQVDRLVEEATYVADLDEALTMPALRDRVAARARATGAAIRDAHDTPAITDGPSTVPADTDTVPCRLTGLKRHFYDGPAFEGAGLYELGAHGAHVRTQELVLTDELLRRAYGGASHWSGPADGPPFLAATPPWSSEYPAAFRDAVPERAGYTVAAVGAYSEDGDIATPGTGYFRETGRVAFDVQRPDVSTDRGLVVARRDALGRTTAVGYDDYDFLEVRTEDPSGLVTEATVDYAAVQYETVTDPNGNRTRASYSPLGQVVARMRLGTAGEREGDTPEQPSVLYDYDYHAYYRTREAESPQPTYVHTWERKRHRWDVVEQTNERRAADGDPPLTEAAEAALFEAERERHPERFVQKRSYFDGHGEPIQTRAQVEAVVSRDASGDDVLPRTHDESPDPGGVVAGGGAADGQVLVSAWKRYNNKGDVVEAFEPFRDEGWAYTTRAEAAADHPEAFRQRALIEYDALGRELRRVGPDGTETREVYGDPSPEGRGVTTGLSDPSEFEPTPWVTYSYDRVDNAGRDAGDTVASAHRWDTPTSVHVDVGAREKTTRRRNRSTGENGADAVRVLETVEQTDLQTATTVVRDELDREALRTVSDMQGNTLRRESLDAGTRWIVYDAGGTRLERRDARGALLLQSLDGDGKPRRTWARDDAGEAVTLRQRVVYGEDIDLDRATAKSRNLLGRAARTYDEGGKTTIERYDFTGSPVGKRQRLLADDVVAGGPVDWGTDDAETLADREAAVLSDRAYETELTYDAQGRLQRRRYPEAVTGETMELQMTYTTTGSPVGADLVVDPDGRAERERYLEGVGFDERGRPVFEAYGNGTMVRRSFERDTGRVARQRLETYDEDASSLSGGGQGTSSLVPGGTVYQDVTYGYDEGGNVVEMREETPGVGALNSPQTTSGNRIVHGRDAQVRRFEYDAEGRLTMATGRETAGSGAGASPRPWGDQSTVGFDGQPGSAPDVGRRNAPDQTAMYTETYSYDPAGNLTDLEHTRHVTRGAQRWTREFGYGGTTAAAWDPTTGEDPSATNRLTHVRDDTHQSLGATHDYDAAGNLVREANSHFAWDHADRLRSYRESAGGTDSVTAGYAYAAGGTRVKKVVDKGPDRREVTEYVDGVFEYRRLETERTAADGPTITENNTVDVAGVARKHVGRPFGASTSYENADRPAVEHQYQDPVKLTSLVVDGDGGWVNREEYTPFGQTTFGGYDRKRYRYLGAERDEESGLYYAQARYYAPWLCRWTTTDPAGPADGLNLYAYVANDPVNSEDPAGTESQSKDNESEVSVDPIVATGDTRMEAINNFGEKVEGGGYDTGLITHVGEKGGEKAVAGFGLERGPSGGSGDGKEGKRQACTQNRVCRAPESGSEEGGSSGDAGGGEGDGDVLSEGTSDAVSTTKSMVSKGKGMVDNAAKGMEKLSESKRKTAIQKGKKYRNWNQTVKNQGKFKKVKNGVQRTQASKLRGQSKRAFSKALSESKTAKKAADRWRSWSNKLNKSLNVIPAGKFKRAAKFLNKIPVVDSIVVPVDFVLEHDKSPAETSAGKYIDATLTEAGKVGADLAAAPVMFVTGMVGLASKPTTGVDTSLSSSISFVISGAVGIGEGVVTGDASSLRRLNRRLEQGKGGAAVQTIDWGIDKADAGFRWVFRNTLGQ